MTTHRVRIGHEAERDLAELADYVAAHDSEGRAEYIVSKLRGLLESLEQNPQRGHFLPELKPLGIKDFREVHFKPYRIIYKVTGRNVFIHLIVDGRRKLQSILERRLLR